MRLSRRRFVLLFLLCSFALHFATKFLLDQPHWELGTSANQSVWQSYVSMVISPFKFVLFGPVNWLMQDPDPPPPLRGIVCAAYWTVLALLLHAALSYKVGRSTAARSANHRK